MDWFELLMYLHVLAMAVWFGSGLAITVIAFRALRTSVETFAGFLVPAAWWAGRAHPAAGVVLLLTGFAMVADRDLSIGETWVLLGLIGLVLVMAIGGALVGRTSDALVKRVAGGGITSEELTETGERLLLYTRIELALLALVIADMIVKPGA
ncbi:MAG TPA: DUF2269 family protein [Solirubrobacteraceae bacterium]|nr:DUF2269 family protein [Solirubrobacteraceae bacterium]